MKLNYKWPNISHITKCAAGSHFVFARAELVLFLNHDSLVTLLAFVKKSAFQIQTVIVKYILPIIWPAFYVLHFQTSLRTICLLHSVMWFCILRESQNNDYFITFRPDQNGQHLANEIFHRIFLERKLAYLDSNINELCTQPTSDNTSSLFDVMPCCRTGNSTLCEPMFN